MHVPRSARSARLKWYKQGNPGREVVVVSTTATVRVSLAASLDPKRFVISTMLTMQKLAPHAIDDAERIFRPVEVLRPMLTACLTPGEKLSSAALVEVPALGMQRYSTTAGRGNRWRILKALSDVQVRFWLPHQGTLTKQQYRKRDLKTTTSASGASIENYNRPILQSKPVRALDVEMWVMHRGSRTTSLNLRQPHNCSYEASARAYPTSTEVRHRLS